MTALPPPPPDGAGHYQPFPQPTMPPPGYAMAAPTGRLYQLKGITMAAMVLLGLASAASIVNAIPLFNRASLADKFPGGATLAQLEDADTSVAAMLLIFGIAWLAAGILFIIWHYRYATNATALRGPLGLGPGWAIGGWFIPLGNLVLPFLQIRQSARASGGIPGIVVGWYVVYLAGALMIISGYGSRPKAQDAFSNASAAIEKFAQADRISAAGFIVYGIAGVLAILMIRALSTAQERGGQQPQADQQFAQSWGPVPTTPPQGMAPQGMPPQGMPQQQQQQPWGPQPGQQFPPPPADPRWGPQSS
jgi:hypothetical protein